MAESFPLDLGHVSEQAVALEVVGQRKRMVGALVGDIFRGIVFRPFLQTRLDLCLSVRDKGSHARTFLLRRLAPFGFSVK